MKNLLNRIALTAVVALGIALLSMPAAAAVQVRVYVPFAFEVGAATLPEGTYTVNSQPGGQYLTFSSIEGTGGAHILCLPMESNTQAGSPRLVFERYGSTYRLSEVWVQSSRGHSVPKTHDQLLVARHSGPPARIEIAMNIR